MKKFSISYGILLVLFSAFVLLEAFVIPQQYQVVSASDSAAVTETAAESTSSTKITMNTYTVDNTQVYVADIYVESDDSDSTGTVIQTAFANNVYGKNVTAATSEIAADNDATLAINGDFYSARSGYVVRNGTLYSSQSTDEDQEDLVIYQDGTFEIIREGDITAQELVDNGAYQVLTFGPGLVIDGSVSVTEGDEVAQAMSSNPRTAIGQISENHYVMVVCDGRTDESEGLSLYQLANFMKDELGCQQAYNLDGGGSSTMYYNGQVVNNPTSGHGIGERSVSDIVYIK